MAENEKELKSLLTKVKNERGKSWLKTEHSKKEDHGIQSHHFMANRWGNNGNSDRLYFGGLQNHCRWWLQPWNKKLAPWKESYDQPRQHIKKLRYYFANKGPASQSYGFSSSHACMDVSWTIKKAEHQKNWCFWTVMLEKTLESPLDCKEIKPVNSKANQSWNFIGRMDAEAEAPILWPPDAKNWLIWRDSDAGKDWRQEEKGMTGWDD